MKPQQVLAFCIFCVPSAMAAHSAVQYDQTRLTLPNGLAVATYSINDKGYCVGAVGHTSFGSFTDNQPVVWSPDGSVRTLDSKGTARDINSFGQIAGTGSTGMATVWDLVGATRILGWGMARAINNHGQVVGQGPDGARLWQPDGGYTDLGTGTVAGDINNRGQVVGTKGVDAFLWSAEDGLRILPKTHFGPSARALSINDYGTIVGFEDNRLVSWLDLVVNDLSVTGYDAHINNAGVIVVGATVLIPGSAPITLSGNAEVTGINNYGTMFGSINWNTDGVRVPVTWTTVPEPPGMLLIASGICACVGTAYRRMRK